MSSRSGRDPKKTLKNQSVTSRCVAVVFKRTVNAVNTRDVNETEAPAAGHIQGHERCSVANIGRMPQEGDNNLNYFTIGTPHDNALIDNHDHFDPKNVFEEFKLRNKTCYWNPALVDSVNNLEYVGFIEPFTILVKGDDIHLENIRTAWGRRVLKDPVNFYIDRIGDVNGIEMQVVPQTQFIPLPEALCLIIMELNNGQIVATLDTVYDKLRHSYQGISLPSNQLVYDTLGQLIRERKVFHTGCGYFVVTPDTFRMHGDNLQNSALLSPWTHLHPMYIPAAFSQQPQTKLEMRSISCQVSVEGSVAQQSCITEEKRMSICNEKLQVELPPAQRVQRSMSVSARRTRDRGRRDEIPDGGSLKRSSSVKGRDDTAKSQCREEVTDKRDRKAEKTKGKGSLLSKLFGRSKKKENIAPTPPPVTTQATKKPSVEYATFSAQFPPPEWLWYQQQLDRQLRTQSWVQQQVAKAGTWHYLNKLSSGSPSSSINMRPNSVPEHTVSMPTTKPTQHFETKFGLGASRKMNSKKSHKHKDTSPVVIANTPHESTRIEVDRKHTYRNSLGQTNIKLSSLPTRMCSQSPSGEVLHSDYVTSTQPMFSSTPRYSTISERLKPAEETGHALRTVDENDNTPCRDKSSKTEKSRHSRRGHKSKKKSHHDRHSSYHPNSRHVSGMSAQIHPPDMFEDDISFEYQGQLQKNSAIGKSQSSGVNCIDLDTGKGHMDKVQGHSKSHRYARSSSYRHSVADGSSDRKSRSQSYRHVVVSDRDKVPKSDLTGQGHIYANLHASEEEETKPKLPERTHRLRPENQHPSTGSDTLPGNMMPSPMITSHYNLELPESDRRSEQGSDRGTMTSNSSQGRSSHDSAIDGTESSEHSLSTVINTRPSANSQFDKMVTDAQMMSLGDSGFCSPRVSDAFTECKKQAIGNVPTPVCKEQNGFLCNNLNNSIRLNNSTGKLEDCSDDSFDRISSDRLYENVRISQKEVLNNMKYLHKEMNVSSQNLTAPNGNVTQETSSSVIEFDPKQSVHKKFNLEGDFHVVGVV